MDKKKLLNIKNFIENENTKTGRLASLRLPRDLSLGGTKSKKAYMPNLNVTRKRDRTKDVFKKTEPNGRGNNHVRDKKAKPYANKQKYIQSSGVFSEGGEEVKRVYHGGDRTVNLRDSDISSSLVIPKINPNSSSVNKTEEEKVFDKLVNCDQKEYKDVLMKFQPVEIYSNVNQNRFQQLADLMDPQKLEPTLPDLSKVKLEHGYSLPMPFASDTLYNDDYPAITVLQLPHSFAGKGLSDDPNVKKIFDYPLNAMLEGKIGKLRIRRSGKMEVQIGRIKYNLNDIGFSKQTSEVVNYVPKDSDSNKAALTVLGQVNNWFTLVPDFSKLSRK